MTSEELAQAVANALRETLDSVPDNRIVAEAFLVIKAAAVKSILVSVVPEVFTQTPSDRDNDDQETTLTINVQLAADCLKPASYAAVLAVANAIADLYAAGGAMRDADVGDATFMRLERNPLLRPDHLYELSIATAPISVTYSHD